MNQPKSSTEDISKVVKHEVVTSDESIDLRKDSIDTHSIHSQGSSSKGDEQSDKSKEDSLAPGASLKKSSREFKPKTTTNAKAPPTGEFYPPPIQ
jgi:hypothetical protein